MKKRYYIVLLWLTVLFSSSLMSFSQDLPGPIDTSEQKIKDAYIKSDFQTVAKLLEQQTARFRDAAAKGENIQFSNLYIKQILLAYVYAWKLNKPDEALLEYQRLIELRVSITDGDRYPHVEYLFMGEIYEAKKDFPKAIEYYQKYMDALKVLQEKEQDDFSSIMAGELTNIAKYRIDGINIKTQKKFKPLLGKWKPLSSPGYLGVLQLIGFTLVPASYYEMESAVKTNLPTRIKQGSSDLGTEVLNFLFVINASASSIDESSEKAMEAYLQRYPDGYFSLVLGAAFYRNYKDNGFVEKEKRMLEKLQDIAKRRKIDLITGPDKRFASPEKTYEIYKKALIEGNIEEVEECYVLGKGSTMKQMFTAIGKDKTKEIGVEMGAIQKIIDDGQTAKYRILRKEEGEDIGYYIIFHNIDGEWKMEPF